MVGESGWLLIERVEDYEIINWMLNNVWPLCCLSVSGADAAGHERNTEEEI